MIDECQGLITNWLISLRADVKVIDDPQALQTLIRQLLQLKYVNYSEVCFIIHNNKKASHKQKQGMKGENIIGHPAQS